MLFRSTLAKSVFAEAGASAADEADGGGAVAAAAVVALGATMGAGAPVGVVCASDDAETKHVNSINTVDTT